MSETKANEQQARPRTVFARHAASVLLVRQAGAGPEVLMGVRAAGHRFAPNRLVFPGGAVDPADRTAHAATEPRTDVLDTLRRSVGPKLARAIVAAAARELREETGLSFGTPPRLDAMRYLCRAITPTRLPVRFNARFFVADAAAVSGQPADSRELQDVRFIPLAATNSLDLMAVTRWTLRVLQDRLSSPPGDWPTADTLHVFRDERPQFEPLTGRNAARRSRSSRSDSA